jgi:dTMP kinase
MAAASSDEYPWQEPTKPVKRGAFIVVEGLDRAGKTTQVRKLCDKLYSSGRNVRTLRFPGKHRVTTCSRTFLVKNRTQGCDLDRTSPIGKVIDSYLQSKTEMDDHAIHLLFSANRWEKAYAVPNFDLFLLSNSK